MVHGGNSHQRQIRRRFVSRQSQSRLTTAPLPKTTTFQARFFRPKMRVRLCGGGSISHQSQYNVTADPALSTGTLDSIFSVVFHDPKTDLVSTRDIVANPIFRLAERLRHEAMENFVSTRDVTSCTPDLTIKVESGRVVVRDRDGKELEPRVEEEVSRVMISEEGALSEEGQKRLRELFPAKSDDLMIFAGCSNPSLNFRTATETAIYEASMTSSRKPIK